MEIGLVPFDMELEYAGKSRDLKFKKDSDRVGDKF